jgi:hypothetical protein
MINLIKLFTKLLLYKFLLFILNIFKQFLFEKHFYLFNKFINLYGPSSVSTEFRRLSFVKDNDKHDELYGDSNFVFGSKFFFNYLKNFRQLKFNLLNFNYLLTFRQYTRSLFFFELNNKKLLASNFLNFSYKKLNNRIFFFDILVEKLKLLYSRKNSIFSYLIIFFEFLFILFKTIFFNFYKKKKITNICNYLNINKNSKNLKRYYELKFFVFNEYLFLRQELKKRFKFLIFFIQQIDFVLNYSIIIFSFFLLSNFLKNFQRINFFIFFIFLNLLRYDILLLFPINFFIFLKNIISIVLLIKKIISFFFSNRLFIFINFSNFFFSNFLLRLKYFFFTKIFYFYKYNVFIKFLYCFIKKRNFAYLNLLSILFTIKKDLKRRYKLLVSQTNSRQKNDFRDLNIQEYINNVLPEDKNKDFYFFSYLSKFLKRKNLYLIRNNKFFFNKNFKRKIFKKYNIEKLKNKKHFLNNNHLNKKKNIFKYTFFFSKKYINNMQDWLFLLKKNKHIEKLSYFLLRKLSFYRTVKQFKIIKLFFNSRLLFFFNIKYLRLSNKIKVFFFSYNTLVRLKISKLKRKKKKRKYFIKYNKTAQKRLLLKFFYNMRKRRILTYKGCFLNKNFLTKFFKKKRIIKRKKLKLYFFFNYFFKDNNFYFRKLLLLKLRKKKRIKKLKKIQKKFLKLHSYKLFRKRKRVNFINFFEQSESHLLNQKKFSLNIAKYRIRSDLTWFTDLHNYTFFHQYFTLKRDRFWYSVSRRETILKYTDGRNMITDSWENNFILQQKSLFFYKEGFQLLFISRNNFINLASLKLLQNVENSVLKKLSFLSLFWKCWFIFLFLFFINFFLFIQFIFIDVRYAFFLSFIFSFSFVPFFISSLFKSCKFKYKFIKICLNMHLRKPYLLNTNQYIFIFYQFFSYILKYFIFKFFLSKKPLNYLVLNFIGMYFLKKLRKFQEKKTIFIKLISYIIMLSFLFYFICLFQIIFEILFFNLMVNFFPYIYLYFLNILILFLFFFYYLLLIFFFFFAFKFDDTILNIIVYFYFNNNYLNYLNFLNKYLFNYDSFNKGLNRTNLNEQLYILKNIKNLQYQNSNNNLRKNAN